jgi:hypothetical protein
MLAEDVPFQWCYSANMAVFAVEAVAVVVAAMAKGASSNSKTTKVMSKTL